MHVLQSRLKIASRARYKDSETEGRKNLRHDFRAMIVCKYWTAQSILPSLLASASLRDYVDRQAMVIERAKSAGAAKSDPLQTAQSDPCCEKNNGDCGGSGGDSGGGGGPLCDDCTLNLTFESLSNDRSFKSDPNDFSAEQDHRPDRFRVARKDVQIQTSGKSWRRRRTKGRSKATSEETRRCKHDTNSDESTARSSNASEMFTDFCADLHHSDRRHYVEKPKLSVRALENKRAEYINKFKSVSRQIEEITATLRETCCGDKNLQNSPDDCDKYFSFSAADSARTKRKLDEGEAAAVLPNESTPKERDPMAVERRTVVVEPKRERRKSAREASRIGYGAINDETPIVPRNAAALPMNRHKSSDIPVHDFARALATDEAARLAGKTPRQGKKRAECRAVKQIAFDLDLTKKRDESREGASMEAGSFSEIYLRDDLGASSSNEYAKVKTIEDLDLDLEELRSKKIAEEKMGERAVLVDIKRRIDRDFDDRSTDRCENEEDFLTISPSQGSGSFENERRSSSDATKKLVTPGGTIDESISTPLLYRQPSDTADVRIRDSTSVVSEYSNRNSLSKYFSCTQFSSLTSLTENENELAFAFEDQDTITRDPSYTNVHSDSNYYDLELSSSVDCLYPDSSPNEYSYSNGDFDRADYAAEYTRQDPRSVCSETPEKFFHERDHLNEMNNVFETSGDLADKIAYEYLPGNRDEAKVSRAELEKRCIGDSTFDSTSKSSRYIGSIDSGVFVNSSLIDFYPHESLAEAGGKPGVKKRTRRARRLNASSVDSSSDGSSCTDDTLGRKVDDVVRDLTKNLILCERRAKMRLEEMQKSFRTRRVSHVCIRGLIELVRSLWGGQRAGFADLRESIN